MQDNDIISNEPGHKPVLNFFINDKEHSTHDQFKTGHELKTTGGVPLNDELYLKVERPWKDELIENDRRIDLALPGKEHFFSKPLHTTIITIESSLGDIPKHPYLNSTHISALVKLVVERFHFDPSGNYKLRVKGSTENLDSNLTIHQAGLQDCAILVFTDIGKGA